MAEQRHLAPIGNGRTRCCGKTRRELGPDARFEYDVARVNCGTYGTLGARLINLEWDRAERDLYQQ